MIVQAAPDLVYPYSDGKPTAENSKQLEWIILLVTNLQILFDDRSDVFVAGNQNWYPVQGEPTTVVAPDVYVIFGRPKGHRDSYKQWEEGDVPMTVVFEVLSPSNDHIEMTDKFLFYDEHGVEEYYIYDPRKNRLMAYVRGAVTLVFQRWDKRFTSPRLGITFEVAEPEMVVYHPDGRRFLTAAEIAKDRRQLEHRLARVIELSRKLRQGTATEEELGELDALDDQGA